MQKDDTEAGGTALRVFPTATAYIFKARTAYLSQPSLSIMASFEIPRTNEFSLIGIPISTQFT